MSIRWSLREIEREYSDGRAKEPRLVITVEGWSDIVRLLLGLLRLQTEFARVGFKGLKSVKRRWGAEKFKHNIESLTGKKSPV